ncbi:hypothetical protein E4U43_004209 [Claviceps pusilla]|uniref:Uncharacterized protein n=1 Tax=Claviceps pusilla TaxID=123648 RepID=A0A9P7SZA9_9HYPO|nr:hypothetical protein E4U43_004209 [Claviceps pusilla]
MAAVGSPPISSVVSQGPRDPFPGYQVQDLTWKLDVFPGQQPLNLTGTIQQVHKQAKRPNFHSSSIDTTTSREEQWK